MPDRTFVREDVIWAAGILEGEGSFGIHSNHNPNITEYPRIQLGMTDPDIVDRIEQIFGVGRLRVRFKDNPRKNLYVWDVCKKNHCFAVAAAIWPWMGYRRQAQIARMIGVC